MWIVPSNEQRRQRSTNVAEIVRVGAGQTRAAQLQGLRALCSSTDCVCKRARRVDVHSTLDGKAPDSQGRALHQQHRVQLSSLQLGRDAVTQRDVGHEMLLVRIHEADDEAVVSVELRRVFTEEELLWIAFIPLHLWQHGMRVSGSAVMPGTLLPRASPTNAGAVALATPLPHRPLPLPRRQRPHLLLDNVHIGDLALVLDFLQDRFRRNATAREGGAR